MYIFCLIFVFIFIFIFSFFIYTHILVSLFFLRSAPTSLHAAATGEMRFAPLQSESTLAVLPVQASCLLPAPASSQLLPPACCLLPTARVLLQISTWEFEHAVCQCQCQWGHLCGCTGTTPHNNTQQQQQQHTHMCTHINHKEGREGSNSSRRIFKLRNDFTFRLL